MVEVEELNLLQEALFVSQYDPGYLLIRQGDPPDKFYIIKKGIAVWSKVDEEGYEVTGAQGGPTKEGPALSILKQMFSERSYLILKVICTAS